MPTNTEAILTHIFVIVDDFCKRFPRKPGPKPKLTDSELITIALYTELLELTSESQQYRHTQRHLLAYFPRLCDRSRFHRRLKRLSPRLEEIRRHLLRALHVEETPFHVLDSTPVPVITFSRAHITPLFPEAAWGHCVARNLTYYGFKLHLAVTAEGVPLHADLTPANIHDVKVAEEILEYSSPGYLVLADKGYLSFDLRDELWQRYHITLDVLKRKGLLHQDPPAGRKMRSRLRQCIEVVNETLKGVFNLERTLAKTLTGLASRVMRKLTAFVLACYLNREWGRPVLAIKTLLN